MRRILDCAGWQSTIIIVSMSTLIFYRNNMSFTSNEWSFDFVFPFVFTQSPHMTCDYDKIHKAKHVIGITGGTRRTPQ